MRWLVLGTMLLVIAARPAPAHAKRMVISEPQLVRTCRSAKTWSGIASCLAKQGTATVVRTGANFRLVQLGRIESGKSVDTGLVLYIEKANQWTLGGLLEEEGLTYELVDIAPLTVGHHTGYRIDIGMLVPTTLSFDAVTSTPATLSMHRVMFCGGESWRCADVITACDILVRGKAYGSFRGTLEIGDGQVNVIGDRTKGGDQCGAPIDKVYLGWPEN